MKVTFLKDHLSHREGDNVELEEDLAAYLLRVGVVTIEGPEDEEMEEKLTKKLKAAKVVAAKHKAKKKVTKKWFPARHLEA